MIERKNMKRFNLPLQYANGILANLSSKGCQNQISSRVSKALRALTNQRAVNLRIPLLSGSYPPDEIVARAVRAFGEGVVEIWLTSEDTGAYGRDIGVSLPELLWKLVDVIPEGMYVRFWSTYIQFLITRMRALGTLSGV